MGGGVFGELVNDFISEDGPLLIEEMKSDINRYIADIVLNLANPISISTA
jgi:hypothetical protein